MRRAHAAASDAEISIVASSLFKRLPVFSSGYHWDCKHPCQERPIAERGRVSRKHQFRLPAAS